MFEYVGRNGTARELGRLAARVEIGHDQEADFRPIPRNQRILWRNGRDRNADVQAG
jgi:hypothetical protein